jgi:hypothetical protein
MTGTNLPEVSPARVNAPAVVGFSDMQSFELSQRVGKMFASSDLVPQRFRNNMPNCAIAINMAARIGADPMMVMQNLYVVHGTPGWSSQFLIATFNHNPQFSALRYEFKGKEGTDDWACRAWAVEKETNEKLYGSWVSIGLAKKEGWYQKNGSKWQTIPEQMLRYRAASWFIRVYAPEVAMGLSTQEEIADTIDMQRGENGTYAPTGTGDLDDKIMAVEPEETRQPEQDTEPLAEQPDPEYGPAPQDEPPAEHQEQPAEELGADINPTDEVSVAEFVLSGEDLEAYKAANAAEKKKKCLGYIQSFGAQVADGERLVGKGYAQWTTKDRAALLGAYSQLANGADPAEVFPTA